MARGSFEALFRIPDPHLLYQVKSRVRGGARQRVAWEHEEYDAGGRLVARFHSYQEWDERGHRRSGWRKYDSAGRLLESHEPFELNADA